MILRKILEKNMKNEKNLTLKIIMSCFALIPLGLTILFVVLAINNPGSTSIKYIIMASFLGVISIAVYIGIFSGLILSKIEEIVLHKGKRIFAEISSAELVFATYVCPNISPNCIFIEYNDKPSLADTKYRISFKFLSSNGKKIHKTAFLSPYVTKQELSFLVAKGNIEIMNYKNHIAFTQEMLNNELKDMPLNQNIITKDNEKVKIKFGMHSLSLLKTKKIINGVKSETKNYKLSIRKKRHIRIDYGSESAQTNYLCCVSYNVNINNTEREFTKYMSIRDFSRIQQLQNEGKSLPVLIKNQQAYIGFDSLPIV